MRWTGLFKKSEWNKSAHTYQFENGSFIEFFGAENHEKVLGARRDVLFVNEANNIDFETYNQLQIRTNKIIYLDYNPTHEFWVHTEVEPDPDAGKVILTYKDNEALEPAIRREIEKAKEKAKTSKYWENWYRVYGLGQVGSLEGVIFQNWDTIDRIPEEAKLVGIGLDFGYTNDPTAAVEIYSWNNKRILNQTIYQKGLLNNEIAKLLPKRVQVWADSSEPKSIDEIYKHGITIKGATKGADSIKYGIDIMQQQDYLVTKQSTDLIKELRNYTWDQDKTGKTLNKPVDIYNHAIDAIRYHEMETVGIKRNYGQYAIR